MYRFDTPFLVEVANMNIYSSLEPLWAEVTDALESRKCLSRQ